MLTTAHFENTSNAAERDYAEDVLSGFEYVWRHGPGHSSQRHPFWPFSDVMRWGIAAKQQQLRAEEEISLLRAEFSHLYAWMVDRLNHTLVLQGLPDWAHFRHLLVNMLFTSHSLFNNLLKDAGNEFLSKEQIAVLVGMTFLLFYSSKNSK